MCCMSIVREGGGTEITRVMYRSPCLSISSIQNFVSQMHDNVKMRQKEDQRASARNTVLSYT